MDGQIRDAANLIAAGVGRDGKQRILGVSVSMSGKYLLSTPNLYSVKLDPTPSFLRPDNVLDNNLC